jgi:hypothetical protein
MIVNRCSNILNTFTVYVGLNRNTECEPLFKYLEHIHGMVKTEHPSEWMWTGVQIFWTHPWHGVHWTYTKNLNSCSNMLNTFMAWWRLNTQKECEQFFKYCEQLHGMVYIEHTQWVWTSVQIFWTPSWYGEDSRDIDETECEQLFTYFEHIYSLGRVEQTYRMWKAVLMF